jgi:hypothetical protein
MVTIERKTECMDPQAFPLLHRLALSDEQRTALTRQGFIGRETRGRKIVFRLRFRFHGKQCALYVSPRDASALEAELGALQRQVHARRRITRLATLARQVLRQHRSTLAPLLEARAYHFHGHQIRRCRNAKRT